MDEKLMICSNCGTKIGDNLSYAQYDKGGGLHFYCASCAKKLYGIDLTEPCCKCGSLNTEYVHNKRMYCEDCIRKLRAQSRFWKEEKQWEILDAMLDIVEN